MRQEENDNWEKERNSGVITVLFVEPMKEPCVKNIPNELEFLQDIVGGDIEEFCPFSDRVGIILNESSKFDGLPLNRGIYDRNGKLYDIIAGNFLIVGLTEEDFCSLTPDQVDKYREMFKRPERFFKIRGEIVSMPVSPEENSETRKSDGERNSGVKDRSNKNHGKGKKHGFER